MAFRPLLSQQAALIWHGGGVSCKVAIVILARQSAPPLIFENEGGKKWQVKIRFVWFAVQR